MELIYSQHHQIFYLYSLIFIMLKLQQQKRLINITISHIKYYLISALRAFHLLYQNKASLRTAKQVITEFQAKWGITSDGFFLSYNWVPTNASLADATETSLCRRPQASRHAARQNARQRTVSLLTNARPHGWSVVNIVVPSAAILSSTSLT